ncbi:MAG: fasciclin domain-containing protein [Reichenbachiella sp.]|uniref:fasciclin domain-containing protein n=1 Tax=Reichenbachiella sp. TaxID=2184521 RepID=UPI0032667AE1
MKNFTFLFLFLVPLFFISCDDDDDTNESTQDIVELAQANGFTSLATALTQVDLISTLQSDGPFTVFAPTNEAFADLLEAVGQTSIEDVPDDVLTDILLYHVVAGSSISSTEISAGTAETAEGSDITIAVGTDGITINSANVVEPFDVVASNGIIHTIDAVLVPDSHVQFVNTVLEPAYFNKSFSTLIEAAIKADAVGTLLNTANLTIFAPTNDAFTASGVVVADTDAADLLDVLTYHVITSKVLSADIPASAATLNGENIYFSLVDAGNFINGDIEISNVDIESGSGVVHVIDKVLIPEEGTVVDVAVALSEDGEFTSLVAALTRTADEGTADQNLITVLSGDGPFTVFAPTDAAFTALLDSNDDWTTLSDIPLETLIAVLQYHVVSGRVYDKDLAGALDANNGVTTVEGSDLTFNLTDLTINTDVNISAVNTHAANGVIHVIDAVLVP